VRLQSIELSEFRNHKEAQFDLRGESALVLGENGSGKTNLIEAIVLLSIGRSFRGSRDRTLTRRGATAFEVRGRVTNQLGMTTEIVARAAPRGGKEFAVDGSALPRLTDLLGRFRTVHFSVEDVSALNGNPAARRRFLDIALCQLEPAYVGWLREYMEALKQRNQLLLLERRGPVADEAEWSAWEEMLARAGLMLDIRRQALVLELDRIIRTLAMEVDRVLKPEIEYPGNGGHEAGQVELRRERLEKSRSADRRVGWTMEGPHRARLRCAIGGEDLTEGASRGYSRLYSILLRLALARLFEERQSDPPVVLLDDPESELDPRWIGRLLRLAPESSQVVVTACRALSEMPERFRRIPIEWGAAMGSAA
jgi:DNA replication and repair protein RecF